MPPVETLDAAKEAASRAGYRVIDVGQGRQCETTDAREPDRTVHVVTVHVPALYTRDKGGLITWPQYEAWHTEQQALQHYRHDDESPELEALVGWQS